MAAPLSLTILISYPEFSTNQERAMNHKIIRLAILLVACTLLLFVPGGAASIAMNPSSVTIQKGGTAEINLVLDEAVSGLAGYDMVIRFSNPSVAEISEVTYPSWAALYNTTRNADGSIRISGVDLSRQVSPGMTDVPLATLKIRALSGGSSSISLESVNMDADGGAMIAPDLATGQIYVPGGSVAPSGGGGGGESSSYQPTQTLALSTPTSSPIVTLAQPTGIASPALTSDTPQPTVTFTSEPSQAATSATLDTPEEGGGIPWTWVLGGIIVLAALFIAAFVAWKREQEQ
jgi:hypothetical protein